MRQRRCTITINHPTPPPTHKQTHENQTKTNALLHTRTHASDTPPSMRAPRRPPQPRPHSPQPHSPHHRRPSSRHTTGSGWPCAGSSCGRPGRGGAARACPVAGSSRLVGPLPLWGPAVVAAAWRCWAGECRRGRRRIARLLVVNVVVWAVVCVCVSVCVEW